MKKILFALLAAILLLLTGCRTSSGQTSSVAAGEKPVYKNFGFTLTYQAESDRYAFEPDDLYTQSAVYAYKLEVGRLVVDMRGSSHADSETSRVFVRVNGGEKQEPDGVVFWGNVIIVPLENANSPIRTLAFSHEPGTEITEGRKRYTDDLTDRRDLFNWLPTETERSGSGEKWAYTGAADPLNAMPDIRVCLAYDRENGKFHLMQFKNVDYYYQYDIKSIALKGGRLEVTFDRPVYFSENKTEAVIDIVSADGAVRSIFTDISAFKTLDNGDHFLSVDLGGEFSLETLSAVYFSLGWWWFS